MGAGTAVVTIIAENSEEQLPEAKRLKLSAGAVSQMSAVGGLGNPALPSMASGQTLSSLEVTAVRQLITGKGRG